MKKLTGLLLACMLIVPAVCIRGLAISEESRSALYHHPVSLMCWWPIDWAELEWKIINAF
mgnify:FL=1